MVLTRYIAGSSEYAPGDLSSLQVAFDSLKRELGLETEEERSQVARLVLDAYEQEGRQTHRIIDAVLRVYRQNTPKGQTR